jgi:xanthine dehydrogenase accessory factor
MTDPAFSLLQERLLLREVSVEVVVVEGPEGSMGARWVFSPQGDLLRGEVPEELIVALAARIRELGLGRRNSLLRHQEYECYLERWTPPTRLFLFGGGHVGRALCGALRGLDFEVHVLEDRPFFADPRRFEGDVCCTLGPLVEAPEKLQFGPEDLVVIATRGHVEDLTCLKEVLPRRPRYLGVLGSRRKIREFHALLLEEGVPPEELDQVRCPMGLDIGAETPEEIAISVVADLILVCSGKTDPRFFR